MHTSASDRTLRVVVIRKRLVIYEIITLVTAGHAKTPCYAISRNERSFQFCTFRGNTRFPRNGMPAFFFHLHAPNDAWLR